MKKVIRAMLWTILSLGVLICGFLAVYTIAEYRPEAIENLAFVLPDDATSDRQSLELQYAKGALITIMSWNIGYGGLGAKQDFFMDGGAMIQPENKTHVEENLTGIVRIIEDNPADIWLVQEMDENSQRSFNINEREFISNATEMGSAYAYNFKCFFVPYPIPFIGRVASGLGIFTDFAVTSSERYSLPVSFSWPVSTSNLKRCMLVSRISLGAANSPELVLVNLHLEAYDDGMGKIAQTKILMDFITSEYEKGNYVVAGGDFNQTFPSANPDRYPVYDGYWKPGALENAMPSAGWQFASDDSVPTCRSNHAVYEPALADAQLKETWQYYVIDGFIVSPNVTLASVTTLDENFKYSDHNPVRIEVKLEK